MEPVFVLDSVAEHYCQRRVEESPGFFVDLTTCLEEANWWVGGDEIATKFVDGLDGVGEREGPDLIAQFAGETEKR